MNSCFNSKGYTIAKNKRLIGCAQFIIILHNTAVLKLNFSSKKNMFMINQNLDYIMPSIESSIVLID